MHSDVGKAAGDDKETDSHVFNFCYSKYVLFLIFLKKNEFKFQSANMSVIFKFASRKKTLPHIFTPRI